MRLTSQIRSLRRVFVKVRHEHTCIFICSLSLVQCRAAFAEFLAHRLHSGRDRLRIGDELLLCIGVAELLRMFWLMAMEQNFGPHIEQKCAIFAGSAGSVSSWNAIAVSGS